ncbi:hypothetical protein PV328_011287 [Microctonus aethiopoides]|uniref:Uncharacterized protein n=1 Tax=Microctonus aethiopoides TaxID=144406 RepID=A0AA39F058_9HYME|nr:hypothetical protein PV328_011287 [Microctonus aethiopoides]
MYSRIGNIYDQLGNFPFGIVTWLWDTVGLIFDIMLEFLGRSVELTLTIINLAFQIICFLRDLCVEAMQTFANVFRGIVNVIGSIDADDVEDFATACIVVILWIGAGRFILSAIDKNNGRYNPLKLFGKSSHHHVRIHDRHEHEDDCPLVQDNTWLQRASKKKSVGSRKCNSTKY